MKHNENPVNELITQFYDYANRNVPLPFSKVQLVDEFYYSRRATRVCAWYNRKSFWLLGGALHYGYPPQPYE